MWFYTSYQQIAQKKQAQRSAALLSTSEPATSTVMVDSVSDFLRATASEIVHRIGMGQWTASEVLEAYITRAVVAQQTTNCLTEILFRQAREEAAALDREFAHTRKLRGALHGVPVSFKDIYDIKGHDTTLGFTSYANKPRPADADLVTLVRSAGGIPFVKTNVAQATFFLECNNPLWGRTISPHNAQFSCGGSSGGEAALLAMDGSALGWGNDIGGSLRIPASNCGIYSLKPGTMRVSKIGARECIPGFDGAPDVMGPMGRSVDDIELACRLVFGKTIEDSILAPVPYREVKLPDKLRLGYYVSDNFVKASPACQRAVHETIDALRRKGHECIEIAVPQPSKAMEILMGLVSADGCQTIMSPIRADPVDSGLFLIRFPLSLFGWMGSITAWLLRTVLGEGMLSRILGRLRRKTVHEYWGTIIEKREYTKTFYKEVWNKHELDGLIAPVLPLPILPHGACKTLFSIATSNVLYNVLECPVGVVPVTHVDPSRDIVSTEWTDTKVGTGHGSPLLEARLYRRGGFYDAEKMAGVPVGVQIVGKRWEEEKVIAIMKVVDGLLGPRGFGPGSWNGQKSRVAL